MPSNTILVDAEETFSHSRTHRSLKPETLVNVRIALIEDDETIAQGLSVVLSAEGFEVECFADGITGRDAALSGRFDLIVLDLMLPRLNGYLVCREVRAAHIWTPIVMLTAKSGEFDQVEGLDTGADDYLVKPVPTVVLLARIRALLRRPMRRVDWPSVGGLKLDPLRRVCFVDDVATPLTSRETEVLAYLLDHPDTVIDRNTILDAVWGPDFAGDPNIVEVYISHLRRKLDDPFVTKRIETVRGEGYRLHTASTVKS